jgi:formylglycine-generating enzyme required for sulfatase activity
VVDAPAVGAARALAIALAVDSKALEPEWSRALPVARPGQPVPGGNGPATVLVVPPAAGRAGVAFMRHEVSRADYAAFASGTGRASARCRNRLAPISFKRRSWASPGFAQGGDHPAVCVSYEDARAYAQWLSQRTGESWRLPTRNEWKQVASYRGTGSACGDGRVDCGQDGTIGAGLGPQSPLGLTGVRGNAREWLNDCDGSCRQHLVGGLGWRDNASRAEPLRTSGFDARTGFDDVGFRLVREVGPR